MIFLGSCQETGDCVYGIERNDLVTFDKVALGNDFDMIDVPEDRHVVAYIVNVLEV